MDTTDPKPTVIAALRAFLPAFMCCTAVLSTIQRRAIWAIEHCRTALMGGSVHGCEDCKEKHYGYHSCNNKACPQCGKGATMEWVERQCERRVSAPYFMVTVTLPSESRPLFFGEGAKEVYDAFFAATAQMLNERLADPARLGMEVSGYSMVLHTWNQQMQFHPHLHCIVPGAGLNAKGEYVQVKRKNFLCHVEPLRAAIRHHFGRELQARGIQCDPAVWRVKWQVNVQPFGDGENAIKYLGRYISRSVIGDSRIVSIDEQSVTLRWKDRTNKAIKGGQDKLMKLPGTEFVRRYLRHVLPDKMHSVRYYGYCHPAAKNKRQQVAEAALARNGPPAKAKQAASPESEAAPSETGKTKQKGYPCPCCNKPMKWLCNLPKGWLLGVDPSPSPRPASASPVIAKPQSPSGPAPPT